MYENGEIETMILPEHIIKKIRETNWTDFADDLGDEYSEKTQADDFYEDLWNEFISDKIIEKLTLLTGFSKKEKLKQ